MDCLVRIKAQYQEFTTKEKKLANFILNNANSVSMWSIHELSNNVAISTASIVRFTRKLGYKGYSHFKHDLARVEYDGDAEDYIEFITQEDSAAMLIAKVQRANRRTFDMTYERLDIGALNKSVDYLLDAKSVLIFALGGSAAVGLDFYHKLKRLGKNAHFHTDSHLHIAEAIHATNETVIVAISYSGETEEIVAPSILGKENGAHVIAVTQYTSSSLSKIADTHLCVVSDEKMLRLGSISSRYSMLALTDMLYVCLAQYDFEKTRENMEKIQKYVEEPKKK